MPDEAISLRDINWREVFPFLHLFRSFRIAVHPSKLFLALFALACLWCGGSILDDIWPASSNLMQERTTLGFADAKHRVLALPGSNKALPIGVAASNSHARDGIFHTYFDYEVSQANNVMTFRGGITDIFQPDGMVESIWRFAVVGPLMLWSNHWFFALLYSAWFLLVWSVCGGAIARIAAVHVALDEKLSVRHALSFSISKVLSFVFAPLIPIMIVLGIGLAIALATTILLHIPYVGPPVAGLFFFMALLGGFVIALVSLGALGGFNLMYPTIAVEGSDSFDAISRAFSYLFARPWRMLWFTGVAIIYGSICYLFVRFFVWIMLAATWFFMSWMLGPHSADGSLKHPADVFPVIWPLPGLGSAGTSDPNHALLYHPDYDHLKGTEAVAAGLINWWTTIVIGLVGAFAISFYFSANTVVYYLMRQEVDATELDEVYIEDGDESADEPVPAAPHAPAGSKPHEPSTVRVYETEEGAPAPENGTQSDPSPKSTG